MDELTDIKLLRKRLNLTQSDLAKQANVSQSLIAKIESNKLEPTYSKAKKIFDTLNNLSGQQENKAKDVMTTIAISVSAEDPIKKAINLMRKHEISQLPVIQNNLVCGMISETTILNNIEDLEKPISAVMEFAPPSVSSETNLSIITTLLKLCPLILVQDKGKVKGIITKADILRNV
ncbi:CBS domain-containing protein [Candidatus Woesearchaeota archaeon]|nr:CBS domain-containing protein [Candidatus Woesearchaeota archaeon]